MPKQKLSRHEMHKYWGKKPANSVLPLIEEYSEKGDTLLDPFAGYGVFCAEAYIANRNIIANDLNPISNFIVKQLLNTKVDFQKLEYSWNIIKHEFVDYINLWYSIKIEDKFVVPISILRSKDDIPLKVKYKLEGTVLEMPISEDNAAAFLEFENKQEITDWYPMVDLIVNSRISAKPNTLVSDLFTKRTLACHARLLTLIKQYSEGEEQDILKLAFSANLANCSKLVPPISTRGEMSQGAWMTGFYIGRTYIENNVLHYFENRLKKVIAGKKDYISAIDNNLFSNRKINSAYKIHSNDAKDLNYIPSSSIDYVFTDPPYGDTVPYFEQSIIWNSWLQMTPDYDNEIVVSDSKVRNKTIEQYEMDINASIAEISRVLKDGKYFSMTYHSLSGIEWKSITNSCIKNNLTLHKYEWLTQKSFSPRQLARTRTIKGDVLVTLKKDPTNNDCTHYRDIDFTEKVKAKIMSILHPDERSTNYVLMELMKWVFENKIVIGNVDVYDILKRNFKLNNDGLWSL